MIPRCKIGKGVTGAIRYILGEGRKAGANRSRDRAGPSRVSWFGGMGFGFDIETTSDADLARRIMEFDAQNQASRTRRCETDCVHLSLGWRPGETPDRAEMERAARAALSAIGMGNAKAVFASHNDESYAHIHIVASKIDPSTGRAYNLRRNYLKLSKWAEQYEREFSGGVICVRRTENNQLRDAIRRRDAAAVVELLTLQRATFRRQDLERALAKEIVRAEARIAFANHILHRPEIVRLADRPNGPTVRYTTNEVLAAENAVLGFAASLFTTQVHAMNERHRSRILSGPKYEGVTREQARAFRHATGAEGLALIDGQAGTGKSFVMAAIREAYQAAGHQVVGLAPTNAVAQDMKRDGFAHAATIHSELFALANHRTHWRRKSVIMVDEAAMIDTKLLAKLAEHAKQAGAKLILIGDPRQLASIERGGLFPILKARYGAATLTRVMRQKHYDDRRASELMAEGKFEGALSRYEAKGAIHWSQTQDEARLALVRRWAEDSAAHPEKSRFVFAYTNADVDQINADIRNLREARGELGRSVSFATKHGRANFGVGDCVQLTGTDKKLGLYNGMAGTLEMIDGMSLTIRLDGPGDHRIGFDASVFSDFRHGYCGTLYRGQGRTVSTTYLYHSKLWRSSASYVALTRHKDKAELFVARETAEDLSALALQMARIDDRRAASHFHLAGPRPTSRGFLLDAWRRLAQWVSRHGPQNNDQPLRPNAARRPALHANIK